MPKLPRPATQLPTPRPTPTPQSVRALHSGWHIAVYLADFSAPFEKIEALGLINNDHPFRCAHACRRPRA